MLKDRQLKTRLFDKSVEAAVNKDESKCQDNRNTIFYQKKKHWTLATSRYNESSKQSADVRHEMQKVVGKNLRFET